MLNALAQTTYTYTTTSTDDGAAVAGLAAATIFLFFIIFLPLIIFQFVCLWKVFEKAGREGWRALIPVYNYWVLAEIVGKPGWWGLVVVLGAAVGSIPVIGWALAIASIVMAVLISIELAKSFGKDPVFALLLIFLNLIGLAILAFGSAKYVGAGGKGGSTPKPAAPAKA